MKTSTQATVTATQATVTATQATVTATQATVTATIKWGKLPQRVFNSPSIRFANFNDRTHVNLVRFDNPYANGDSYAVIEITKSPYNSNGLFKDLDQAEKEFNLVVTNTKLFTTIRNEGKTRHY